MPANFGFVCDAPMDACSGAKSLSPASTNESVSRNAQYFATPLMRRNVRLSRTVAAPIPSGGFKWRFRISLEFSLGTGGYFC